jgi:hypothetical protein
MDAAAANLKAGSVRFEEVSRYNTPYLGYVVQLSDTRCSSPAARK